MNWVDHQRSYTRETADAGDLEEIGCRGSENNSPDQNLKDLTRPEMLLVKGLQHYSRCVKHLRRCFTTFQNIAKFVKLFPWALMFTLFSVFGNVVIWKCGLSCSLLIIHYILAGCIYIRTIYIEDQIALWLSHLFRKLKHPKTGEIDA